MTKVYELMEDNFNPDNFEEFLQQQVRNQRMYPNDAVWRDINKKLHGEKRWPALTIAAFLLLSATIAICIHFTSRTNIFSLKPVLEPAANSKAIAQSGDVLSKLSSATPFTGNNAIRQKIATPGEIEKASAAKNNAAGIAFNDRQSDPSIQLEERELSKNIVSNEKPILQKPASENAPEAKLLSLDNELNKSLAVSETAIAKNNKSESKKVVNASAKEQKDYNDKNMADDFLKDHKSDVALHTVKKPHTNKNKFGLQVYVAPSFSYRKLVEDKSLQQETTGGPVGINYVTDVNNVVRHKPGTGIEAGLSIFYNLSDKVRLKSGLQFNVRQYSIDAYRSNSEMASIALVGANRIDTINRIAYYRNNNGYKSTELVNRYYQFAVPIGIEWEVVGTRKIQLNVAASIQPTYLVNRNAYLLSTNFKNYTESPDMVRRWNLNSNIEAFISYQVGDFKWQIGPQLRYQPYSTFIAEYPIKEHLLDYGLKVGFSKTF